METRRGRGRVIDLTASVSPPDAPRPLIATASIAPRRRLRDGSHSSRSSTATLSDVIGTIGNASGSGSGSGVRAFERKRTGDRQNSDDGQGSTSSDCRSGRSQRPEASAGPRKRARTGPNTESEERSNTSAMSRGPSYTTRPVIIPSTSNIRTNHPSPRPPTINDFEAESSDENLPGGTISASAANEIVQETDEDKTDTMTVNADAASESEVQQFEILEDSELESGSVPLRDTVVRTSEDIEEIQVNALAGGLDDEDMDGFEIVSPVQTTKGLKIVKEAKDRGGNQYPLDSVKGKGRAIAVAAPGEPSENLLASFECPICFMPPAQAVLTPCGHIMCGKCLFDTLKSQAIRDGKRPNPVGQYPVSRPLHGRRRTKKEMELERSRPSLRGRLLTGSCPVCRKELEGGFGTVAGEGGVKYLEIRTLTEL